MDGDVEQVYMILWNVQDGSTAIVEDHDRNGNYIKEEEKYKQVKPFFRRVDLEAVKLVKISFVLVGVERPGGQDTTCFNGSIACKSDFKDGVAAGDFAFFSTWSAQLHWKVWTNCCAAYAFDGVWMTSWTILLRVLQVEEREKNENEGVVWAGTVQQH